MPEDFWAYSFKLINSHLFQQKLMPVSHDNDVTDVILVVMLLQTVIEVVYQFLLLKFTENCNQLLPDVAPDSARCMGFSTYCTCLATMPP